MFPSLSFLTSRLPKLSRSLNATGLGDGNLLGGITVQYGGSITSTRKRKKALLIGINYATHPDRLKRLTKPQSDVEVMKRLLGRSFDCRYSTFKYDDDCSCLGRNV